MPIKTGKFITFEGGEGVGKSLLIRNIAKQLEALNTPHILTYEPGGTPVADDLRKMFKQQYSGDAMLPLTELFVVSAARSQHIGKIIQPALRSGSWVLCDRFYDSTRVYQGILPQIPEKTVEEILAISTFATNPDLTLLLDCDVDISIERITKRIETLKAAGYAQDIDRYDLADRSFHTKLREAFLAIARKFPDRFLILDASQPPDRILQHAMAALKKRFGPQIS